MPGPIVEAPVLVGRAVELQHCDRLIDAGLNGRGALLLVSREAGMGKTTLVSAVGARATAAGAIFATGRCFETDAIPAFGPWQDLLRQLPIRTGSGRSGRHSGMRSPHAQSNGKVPTFILRGVPPRRR